MNHFTIPEVISMKGSLAICFYFFNCQWNQGSRHPSIPTSEAAAGEEEWQKGKKKEKPVTRFNFPLHFRSFVSFVLQAEFVSLLSPLQTVLANEWRDRGEVYELLGHVQVMSSSWLYGCKWYSWVRLQLVQESERVNHRNTHRTQDREHRTEDMCVSYFTRPVVNFLATWCVSTAI